MTGVNIFICYSHKDEVFKDVLLNHLSCLKRQKLINAWEDRAIQPGEEWFQSIIKAIENCDIALLLVSANFLSSDFINNYEIRALFMRKNNIVIVPIILSPCTWKLEPFSYLNVLPKDGKPIITFPEANGERDEAWTTVIFNIKKIIEKKVNIDAIKPNYTYSNFDCDHNEHKFSINKKAFSFVNRHINNEKKSITSEIAAKSLLSMDDDFSREIIREHCNKYPQDPFHRKVALHKLLEIALESTSFIECILNRAFTKNDNSIRHIILDLLQKDLHNSNAKIVIPSEVLETMNRLLSDIIISNRNIGCTYIYSSCLGVMDSFNMSVHEQTMAIRQMKIGINHPSLLVDIAFNDDDYQVKAPKEYTEFYFLSDFYISTKLDILRKLSKLFSNIYSINDFFYMAKELKNSSICLNDGISIFFFRKQRPSYTFRIIKETGDYFLFPDSLPVPRPYGRFGIFGRNRKITDAVLIDFQNSVTSECLTDNLTIENIKLLEGKSLDYLHNRLISEGITETHLENIRHELPVISSVKKKVSDSIIDQLIKKFLI